MRFPGAGKKRSNRAGWCRLITPTLAIYGDWSSDFSAVWTDDSHRDSEETKRLLDEARKRSREMMAENRRRQAKAAQEATRLVASAQMSKHAYLARKGFPDSLGLVHEGRLLIPVRDVDRYDQIISVQFIAEDGEKRFLPGGRVKGGIYRLGVAPGRARRLVLCEGYATALSLFAALQRLPGPHTVIACFSANNLDRIAKLFPEALVAADHDVSGTGEAAARRTGNRWCMPPQEGDDFNDFHRRDGLMAVTEVLRSMF